METNLKQIGEEERKKLRAPFPPEAMQKHPTKTYLTTIKAMYVVERLNDVFGVGKWELVTELVLATNHSFVVKGKLVSNYWDFQCTAQYGGHTIGEKDKMDLADGYKSAVTDCMSKVASLFEIGIDVFKGLVAPPSEGFNPKATAQTYAKPAPYEPSPVALLSAPVATQTGQDKFVHDGYEYMSAISSKTGKRWYARQAVGTTKKEWMEQDQYEDIKFGSSLPEGFEEVSGPIVTVAPHQIGRPAEEAILDPLPF